MIAQYHENGYMYILAITGPKYGIYSKSIEHKNGEMDHKKYMSNFVYYTVFAIMDGGGNFDYALEVFILETINFT